MCRRSIFCGAVLRTKLYRVLHGIRIVRCRCGLRFCVFIVHNEAVAREDFLFGVHVFIPIPLLNHPILECQLGLAFTCCRCFCCRTSDSFSLIGVLVRIGRCISTCNGVAIAVLTYCGVENIDSVSTIENSAPTSVEINFTNGAWVFRVVSAVCTI